MKRVQSAIHVYPEMKYRMHKSSYISQAWCQQDPGDYKNAHNWQQL